VREVENFLTQRCRETEVAEEESGRARTPAAPQNGRAVAPRPPMEIIFCCFSVRDAVVYERLMK